MEQLRATLSQRYSPGEVDAVMVILQTITSDSDRNQVLRLLKQSQDEKVPGEWPRGRWFQFRGGELCEVTAVPLAV